MSSNWLETGGSWLSKPFRAVAGPWWEKHVEEKAANTAVRQKLLEAIVCFRLNDFGRQSAIDPDRAVGLAARIIEQLKPRIAGNKDPDLTAENFLRVVENEIQVQAVPLTAWAELACLHELSSISLRNWIVVEITNDRGRRFYGSTLAAALQSSFPFTQIFTMTGADDARLSVDATDALRGYCSRSTLPEVKYELRDYLPVGSEAAVLNPHTLARGWMQPPEQRVT
jgi:hypothetical protein